MFEWDEKMKKKHTRMSLGEGLETSKTDWEKLEKMSDDDIDYRDIPELDEITRQGIPKPD